MLRRSTVTTELNRLDIRDTQLLAQRQSFLLSHTSAAVRSRLLVIFPPNFSISETGFVLEKLTIAKTAKTKDKMAKASHLFDFLNFAIMILFFDVLEYPPNTKVTDAGLVHLKSVPHLQALYLDDTQVSDAGLVHLKGFPRLLELYLEGTQVTDAGLVHLKGLSRLRSLGLGDIQESDQGRQELLRAIPSLRIY